MTHQSKACQSKHSLRYRGSTLIFSDLPSVDGSCDEKNFYITVQYGSKGPNFETLVGGSLLTTELAQRYGFNENGTHFILKVPFGSPDIAFEVSLQ